MLTVFHHIMSSSSRAVRLILYEFNMSFTLVEEHEWARRREFLQLNPAGSVPVLLNEHSQPVSGIYSIIEYLDETIGALNKETNFFPKSPIERAEIRRLISWFLEKFNYETAHPIVRQRIYKREMPTTLGGGAPDSTILRCARNNIKPHMEYLNWLTQNNNCLAGSKLTYADFAAAACVSVLDYMDEIDWSAYDYAKQWYMRIKSRPSMRPLLFDRVAGLAPSTYYTSLDF